MYNILSLILAAKKKKIIILKKNKEALLKKVAPYIQENRPLSRLIYQLEESDAKRFKGLKKEIVKHFYY